MPELESLLTEKLAALQSQTGTAREMQESRENRESFQADGPVWVSGTVTAWRRTLVLAPTAPSLRALSESTQFQLMDNDVMESRILASRLALRLLDFASWELNDLRLRIQSLEGLPELRKDDIFRPEVLAKHTVDQWTRASLSRELWLQLQDTIQAKLAERLMEAYHKVNEFLVQNGVMAEIDLRQLVKRTPSAVMAGRSAAPAPVDSAGFAGNTVQGAIDLPMGSSGSYGRAPGPSAGKFSDFDSGAGSDISQQPEGRGAASAFRAGEWSNARGRSGPSAAAIGGAHDETRMQTGTTPLGRARMRAQGVMGQLKRLLSNQIAGFDDTQAARASPQLEQAMASVATENPDDGGLVSYSTSQVYGPAQLEQAAGALRQRTSTLKKAATSSSEKATIEIVALMFQSILSEERIPAAVRVWFARLQMPVLRVAISEPEFFGSLQHPARRLIDRMGSCVLGFDADVSGSAMEVEIKRVVQVIEQYPETGRRVFQLVYDEFQKFLSKFLSGQGSAARVVSVAQQVEQKETMAIQYTIEMRSMLNDMPVREEIREFLFKIWAEVLAIAAVKNGPQHQETITLKRAAADLVWAASAKPNRNDRAKVIADLPKLLQLLRLGMAMLNLSTRAQDLQIKVISDTLADAFMSRTDAISMERIEIMAKRLANLEDYLSDEDVGDLPLDTESLVMMIGIDAADLEVITDGGSHPGEAMRAWAQELQLGSWFSLDHNGKGSQVQFAWRSERKQLHLFASADGRNFLIQSRRLAAYLQAGLLVPTEDEALTVRATRAALAKIDANPERLLE